MIVATDLDSPDCWRINFSRLPIVFLDGERIASWLEADDRGSVRSILLVNGSPVVAPDGISVLHRNMTGIVRIMGRVTPWTHLVLYADFIRSGSRRRERSDVLRKWVVAMIPGIDQQKMALE